MRIFLKLAKSGIVLFAIFTALAGFAVSYPVGQELDPLIPILLIIGLGLASAGGFVLNQVQEWKLDLLMPRTAKRPIPSGQIQPWQAWSAGILLVFVGLFLLALIGWYPFVLTLITLVFYNGFYTMWWKRHWAFAAVPGAIPGALPVTIGYSVNNVDIFSATSIYLFLILFLWQMPHFWSLSLKFREDYAAAKVPVLPVVYGEEKTFYHMGLYTFVYIGVALAAPWFIHVNVFYLLLLVPLCVKLLIEFFRYQKNRDKGWLSFFLWINLSVLVFLAVPVIDKWIFWIVRT